MTVMVVMPRRWAVTDDAMIDNAAMHDAVMDRRMVADVDHDARLRDGGHGRDGQGKTCCNEQTLHKTPHSWTRPPAWHGRMNGGGAARRHEMSTTACPDRSGRIALAAIAGNLAG
jgi:hypothetical protein